MSHEKITWILTRLVLPVAVVVIAILGAVMLVKSKPEPQRNTPPDRGVLVEVSPLELEEKRIEIEGLGSVIPARRVVVQAQVGGVVTWVNPNLVMGGRVKEGDVLLKVDSRDYQVQVEERRAAMEQAEAQLLLEQGQQVVAQREWELFKDSSKDSTDPSLALRGPQRRIAEVNVEAAKARLRKAQLDLGRTNIKAPFNAFVQSGVVEVGQVVSPQSQIATLIGTDEFWVNVSVPVDALQGLKFADAEAHSGTAATVVQEVGTKEIERSGTVLRLVPELDTLGKMARVMVRIDDPLGLENQDAQPILLGAQVRVTIDGTTQAQVAKVPRSAVHNGRWIYVWDDGKLLTREVFIVDGTRDDVWISGVEAKTPLITSRIATPVDGMKLRRAGEE